MRQGCGPGSPLRCGRDDLVEGQPCATSASPPPSSAPIQKADSRQVVVARMVELMDQAARRKGADLIVYPELALTTFFPRWHYEDRAEADFWFEREMPNAATRPLFERARKHGMAHVLRLCRADAGRAPFQHLDPRRPRRARSSASTARCTCPGHAEYDPERTHQHLEKRYFEPGDLGFPVWRMHRRHPRHVHLQRPALARDLPRHGAAGRRDDRARLQHAVGELAEAAARRIEKRMFHHRLSLQAGAYQNSDLGRRRRQGRHRGRASLHGRHLHREPGRRDRRRDSRARRTPSWCTTAISTRPASARRRSSTSKRHRRIEHYGRITAQVGAEPPE